MLRIGLLSDTHGLLRPEARDFLGGSDFIIHAGDIGEPAILDELAGMAPVTAVRGNCDRGAWAARLPETALLRAGGVLVQVIHDRSGLAEHPLQVGVRVVVFGHSHQPEVDESAGVLLVNPGSCGPRRFRLPVSVGELMVDGALVSARIVNL